MTECLFVGFAVGLLAGMTSVLYRCLRRRQAVWISEVERQREEERAWRRSVETYQTMIDGHWHRQSEPVDLNQLRSELESECGPQRPALFTPEGGCRDPQE